MMARAQRNVEHDDVVVDELEDVILEYIYRSYTSYLNTFRDQTQIYRF